MASHTAERLALKWSGDDDNLRAEITVGGMVIIRLGARFFGDGHRWGVQAFAGNVYGEASSLAAAKLAAESCARSVLADALDQITPPAETPGSSSPSPQAGPRS